jgi:hypothetical protein
VSKSTAQDGGVGYLRPTTDHASDIRSTRNSAHTPARNISASCVGRSERRVDYRGQIAAKATWLHKQYLNLTWGKP